VVSRRDDAERAEAARLSRRGFLGAGLGAGIGAGIAAGATGAALSAAAAGPTATPGPARSYPFHGEHQQGILTPAQRHASYVAFDVTAASRTELQELLQTITDRARFLTTGGVPAELGISAPPSDSGVLGDDIPADGLTVTASVGASLFDDRYGLASAKPARLRRMEDFPNDALDRATCDGDLLLQLCAENPDTLAHAVRDIMRQARGGIAVRWRKDGFMSPPRPTGTPRNLMGFRDGTANPATTDAHAMSDLIWAGAGEPTWAVGGSYHIVRVIRMLVEFWDRVSVREQEYMIGRHRDSGAPLTGTHEFDDPHFENDPTADVITLNSHIRRANPRTPGSEGQRMLRRSYNYSAGTDSNGNLDMGLIFTAFNQDLERQFVTVQKRLADEPLVDYISPTGGGYFFALPGVRSASDWLGRGMFA
jgi:deferrochelatase/peroxidase EfeB